MTRAPAASLRNVIRLRRRSFLLATCAATLGLCGGRAIAATAPAQSVNATAAARTTILRPITVSPVAELSFGRLQHSDHRHDGSVVLPARSPSVRVAVRVKLHHGDDGSPLIRSLTGEPGRIYRIGLPRAVQTRRGQLTVTNFTLWSSTRGDISTSRLGALNGKGSDTLRLGATLLVPRDTKLATYAAVVPVTISYE